MNKVLIQIGYKKSSGWGRNEGQIIQAWVNEEECTWSETGKWLTPYSDSNRRGWYYWKGDLSNEDLIRVEIKTTIPKKGSDEKRTMEMLFVVNEEFPVKEVIIPRIGYKNYPILKGRIKEIAKVSEADKREQEIDSFLEEDF